MSSKALTWRLLDFGLVTSAVTVLLIAVFTFGPWLETTFLPVYSKFKIISMEELPDGQAKVVFRFTKLRQCEPQGAAWFFGEPGSAFRQLKVTVQNPNPTSSRPLGTQITYPYVMDVTVEQLADATFAEIFNRCHPFWLTRSEIYP